MAMTSEFKSSVGVPKFIQKLAKILSTPELQNLISWDTEGDVVCISNQNEFIKRVSPKYFKHRHFASFVRQLNCYGFIKVKRHCVVTTTRACHPRAEIVVSEFLHPYFRRGREDLFPLITRKFHPHQSVNPPIWIDHTFADNSSGGRSSSDSNNTKCQSNENIQSGTPICESDANIIHSTSLPHHVVNYKSNTHSLGSNNNNSNNNNSNNLNVNLHNQMYINDINEQNNVNNINNYYNNSNPVLMDGYKAVEYHNIHFYSNHYYQSFQNQQNSLSNDVQNAKLIVNDFPSLSSVNHSQSSTHQPESSPFNNIYHQTSISPLPSTYLSSPVQSTSILNPTHTSMLAGVTFSNYMLQ